MKNVALVLATIGGLVLAGADSAQAGGKKHRHGGFGHHSAYAYPGYGYGFGGLGRYHATHGRFHDDLSHRAFHRELHHREAHRYPMTWRQHERLHDALEHDAFHDHLEHREFHRRYDPYVPRPFVGRGFYLYYGR